MFKIQYFIVISTIYVLGVMLSNCGGGGGGGGGASLPTRTLYSALSTDGLVFTKEAGTRISSGSVPDLVTTESDGSLLYMMYYVIPGDENVLLATSSDGLSFSSAQTVIPYGSLTEDAYGAVDPAIIKVSGTEFRMYYVGHKNQAGTDNYLMFATSADGYTWNKQGAILGHNNLSDITAVATGENYRIYYSDKDDLFTVLTSSDGYTTIEAEQQISLPYGCTVPHILYTGSAYRLYYNRSPKYNPEPSTKYALRSATSTDLVNFTTEEGYRYENADAGCVIKLTNGNYRLYYQVGTD